MKAPFVLLLLFGLLSNLAAAQPHAQHTLQSDACQHTTLTSEQTHDGDDETHLLTTSDACRQSQCYTCSSYVTKSLCSHTETLYQARAPPQNR